MPVRDVETFAAPRADVAVLANRGANGIDGTLATAYGIAAAGAPTALLVGDVTLAHDVGGLLAGARLGLPLVPGSPGPIETVAEAKAIAAEIGYPVLIKAAAGGGASAGGPPRRAASTSGTNA